MTLPNPSVLRLLFALAAVSALASGCAINGNYQNPTQADAAKLRFITKIGSTNLDLFDAQHCEGRSAGLLNNLFAANTVRRADMKVPAPADAGPYIEIALAPGKEQLVRTNMIGTGYAVCTSYTNITPQPGAEYELTLTREGNKCVTSLTTLHQLNGKVSRLPLPISDSTLPACAGKTVLFPAFNALPDTPARTAMIDRIIADSITPAMTAAPEPSDPAASQVAIAKQLAERKKRMDIVMPDDYWAGYRQNLEAFHEALETQKVRALQFYKDDSRKRLRSMQTEELEKIAKQIDTEPATSPVKYTSLVLGAHGYLSRRNLRDDYGTFNSNMADLDKRFGVCERYVDCWRK